MSIGHMCECSWPSRLEEGAELTVCTTCGGSVRAADPSRSALIPAEPVTTLVGFEIGQATGRLGATLPKR